MCRILQSRSTLNGIEGRGRQTQGTSDIQILFYCMKLYSVQMCGGLFIEYMKYGAVDKFLQDFDVPPAWRIQIIYETASAMSYLHEQNPIIIHGDLSSQNILIGDRFSAKICDFGLARLLKENCSSSQTNTPLRGKASYIAPEYFSNSRQRKTEKFDVYGFAISSWEILSKQEAYYDFNDRRLIWVYVEKGERPKVKDIDIAVPRTITKLIEDSWQGNQNNRPTFKIIRTRLFEYTSTIQPELMRSYSKLIEQERQVFNSKEIKRCESSPAFLEGTSLMRTTSTGSFMIGETILISIRKTRVYSNIAKHF